MFSVKCGVVVLLFTFCYLKQRRRVLFAETARSYLNPSIFISISSSMNSNEACACRKKALSYTSYCSFVCYSFIHSNLMNSLA